MGKNVSKNELIICIIFSAILGGLITIFLYLQFFPSYSDSVRGGYFKDYLQNKNSINLNDFEIYQGSGVSMSPSIPHNSLTLVIKGEIKKGDVIVFENKGFVRHLDQDYIEHRVIKIRERNGKLEYLTKGDNVKYADGWIPEERVIGKIVGVLY